MRGLHDDVERRTDAELTCAMRRRGTRSMGIVLPGSPKVVGNLAVQLDSLLPANYDAYARVDGAYTGTFYGNLKQSPLTKPGGYVASEPAHRHSHPGGGRGIAREQSDERRRIRVARLRPQHTRGASVTSHGLARSDCSSAIGSGRRVAGRPWR